MTSMAALYSARIGHAQIKVRDLDRAIVFYTWVFNFGVVERVGNRYAFLGGPGGHHVLALQSVGVRAPKPVAHGTGLNHLAFQVPDRAALAAAYRLLKAACVAVERVDHHISWSIYFRDPDDNGLELYCDTRAGQAELWRGRNAPLTEEQLMAGLDYFPGASL
jgi:catechol 2,3-dioxygenase